METIYSNIEIKKIEDLRDIVSICYNPPEGLCQCKKCFKYEISIVKDEGFSREEYEK